MPANRPEGPDDRFAPPDGGHDDMRLDIAGSSPRPRPTGTLADDAQLLVPEGRKPVVYKQQGGFGNLVIWLIGGACLVGAAAFGAVAAKRMFADKTAPTGAAGGPAAAGAAAAPAKPVTWTAVTKGDAVLVTVEATPRHARLSIDGAALESNPIRLARGGTHIVQAVADGFEPASAQIVADGAKTVRLKLKKSPR
jgi:hypothetical protein